MPRIPTDNGELVVDGATIDRLAGMFGGDRTKAAAAYRATKDPGYAQRVNAAIQRGSFDPKILQVAQAIGRPLPTSPALPETPVNSDMMRQRLQKGPATGSPVLDSYLGV